MGYGNIVAFKVYLIIVQPYLLKEVFPIYQSSFATQGSSQQNEAPPQDEDETCTVKVEALCPQGTVNSSSKKPSSGCFISHSSANTECSEQNRCLANVYDIHEIGYGRRTRIEEQGRPGGNQLGATNLWIYGLKIA